LKLRVPGIVKPNEYREVHVTPLVGGLIKEVPVVLGDHVKRGQSLAVIFSSELAEAETQYVSYLAELEAEHKKLERTRNLVKLGAASQQEEEEVAATHAAHESHVRAAREKLTLLGASDRQIAALQQAEQINPNLVVPAPISGVVLTRSANLGLVVSTAQELFTVVDLSTVWTMASVSEKDFASVRVGSAANVTAPAYPGKVWKGHVTYIQPQVDPNTRTAQARIEVANPGENLRIDMYVDVEFISPGAPGPVVPEAAVQSIGERQFVFLPVKNNEGSFQLRAVRLGPAANGYYAVLEGLNTKEEVVTDGSFILKAEAIRQHPELH
jgi:RND family efflux transporter MFP subunit